MLGAVLTAVLFSSILVPGSNAAIGPTASMTITNKIIAPDGFQRSAVVTNGIHPGPVIAATKGDQFRLNVINGLTDPTMLRGTSVHWHGLFQKNTAWADGPVGVSQCPISAGRSFLYDFSSAGQTGTFWYHSHFGTQYCDGLSGAIVIYDPQDPHKWRYDVDNESTIITLGDWYHKPAPEISGTIAYADSTLINGKGRYPGGPLADLSIVNVEFGKRYRFRLISISCDPNFLFSIDGHSLTVIEADGESTKPLTVDRIQIFTGQRYSFILTANKIPANYWIRALPNTGVPDLLTGYTNGINSAILRYKGALKRDPITSAQANPRLLKEADLRPLKNPGTPGNPYPGGADVNINLTFRLDEHNFEFLVNEKSYVNPTVPVLLQIMSGAQLAEDLLPNGSVYMLPKNKVIEISMPAGSLEGGPHPFHLHGHAFSVVRSEGANAVYNYENPIRRDVVNAGGPGSNVTIRFVTDNSGPWFLHCHIEFHLEMGLAVVFAEDHDGMELANPAPPAWDALCPIYDALPPSATNIVIN